MTSSVPARRRTALVIGVVLLAASAALGATVLLLGNGPFAADTWWNDLLAGWTSDAALDLSWAMNDIGGGWIGSLIVPLVFAVLLVVLRRPWGAVYFLAASALSAVVVQVLKHLFGRARPEDIIVVSDFGSFPSGHTAHAATLAIALLVVFPRVWVGLVGAGWVLLMAFSRTYLHAHWLSDTVGGALAGAGAALVMAAAFATLLEREAARRTDVAGRRASDRADAAEDAIARS